MYESGAHDPESDKGRLHAIKYYESIRKRSSDIIQISKNTGLGIEVISAIKSHVFFSYHDLDAGYMRFSPSYEMAESWRRLSGKNKKAIQPHDLVLLEHEYTELMYLLNNKGSGYQEAHEYASKRHNYQSASDAYYDRILGRK